MDYSLLSIEVMQIKFSFMDNSLLSIEVIVTISLEQEQYTVIEDEGPLTVCAEIVDISNGGLLDRSFEFTIRVFQGPGSAVGESGLRHVYQCCNQG